MEDNCNALAFCCWWKASRYSKLSFISMSEFFEEAHARYTLCPISTDVHLYVPAKNNTNHFLVTTKLRLQDSDFY